jgi:hypothetical protein
LQNATFAVCGNKDLADTVTRYAEVARLKDEFPAIYARVVAGEISAYAGAVDAVLKAQGRPKKAAIPTNATNRVASPPSPRAWVGAILIPEPL